MKTTKALLISLTILLLTVIFTLQNAQISEIKLLFWYIEASLSLFLFITLAIGGITAIIAFMPVLFRLRAEKKKLERKIEELETINQIYKTKFPDQALKSGGDFEKLNEEEI